MPGCQHTQVHALQRVSAQVVRVTLLAVLAAVPAYGQSELEFARQLYNQGRFDQAIAAASRVKGTPSVDAANLVLGRAYLERFRKSTEPTDLVAGREALRDVRPAKLTFTDRTDYLVGLGEALYLAEQYGPAVELFRTALDRAVDGGPRAFERIFDWWATALDRLAQSGEMGDRDLAYQAIRDRARDELGRMPGSASASYWLVVSYRYLGDLTNAWDAAVAGWIRAPFAEDQGRALRSDLDQLVLQAIIPERVRLLAYGDRDRDRDRVAASLQAAWEAVKKDWPTR
jgi:hypothetical protein